MPTATRSHALRHARTGGNAPAARRSSSADRRKKSAPRMGAGHWRESADDAPGMRRRQERQPVVEAVTRHLAALVNIPQHPQCTPAAVEGQRPVARISAAHLVSRCPHVSRPSRRFIRSPAGTARTSSNDQRRSVRQVMHCSAVPSLEMMYTLLPPGWPSRM